MNSVIYHPEQRYLCREISIAADSFGDKSNPPVLLIMGLATQLVHWDEGFCRQLAAQGYWVIRFDNRDIGRSDHLSHLKSPNLLKLAGKHYFNTPFVPAYSLEDMANDAVALLDTLKVKAAHVIGVSMGGMIAQLLAIHHPEKVLSLTSIMSGTGNKKLMRPNPKVTFTVMRPPPRNRSQHVGQAMNMWRVLHGDHFPFEEERTHNVIVNALQRGFSARGVMRQFSAIVAAEDRAPKLQNIEVPSLIVHGDADPLVPVANGIATAQSIPDAKLQIIKGMGHTIPTTVWPELIDNFEELVRTA